MDDGSSVATVHVVAGAGYNVGSPDSATGVITNDDVPLTSDVTVAVSPAFVLEKSGTPMVYTFRANLARSTATALRFTPPVASARYSTNCVSPITLPALATTVSCSVTPIDNSAKDGSETATVTLLASPGVYTVPTPSAATGTIIDDESSPIGPAPSTSPSSSSNSAGVVATSSSAIEGGTAVFTLRCVASGGSAIFNYSFSGNYSPLPASGSRLVTCGSPFLVLVPISDDSIINGTRTVTLTINGLAAVTGGVVLEAFTTSATVSILDNEGPAGIPTLSTLGLALLGLLLAAIAGFPFRRR
jgi:hypothetical protein